MKFQPNYNDEWKVDGILKCNPNRIKIYDNKHQIFPLYRLTITL
jgi:hypothetical protein